MNVNKKVFWWSLLFFCLSIIGIVIFNILYKNYPCYSIFSIFLNIFISLVGGAMISLVTSSVSFYQLKKQYEIKFYSEISNIRNILKNLLNWFSWKYDEIKYNIKNESNIDNNDFNNVLDNIILNNNNCVKEFANIITKYIQYDFNNIYYILDDYCSFRLFKRNNKIRIKMYEIMNEINKHNILYDEKMNLTFTLYKQGTYDEYILYENIIEKIKSKYYKTEAFSYMKKLNKEYLKLTKIDDYTQKLSVSINKTKKENKDE